MATSAFLLGLPVPSMTRPFLDEKVRWRALGADGPTQSPGGQENRGKNPNEFGQPAYATLHERDPKRRVVHCAKLQRCVDAWPRFADTANPLLP